MHLVHYSFLFQFNNVKDSTEVMVVADTKTPPPKLFDPQQQPSTSGELMIMQPNGQNTSAAAIEIEGNWNLQSLLNNLL